MALGSGASTGGCPLTDYDSPREGRIKSVSAWRVLIFLGIFVLGISCYLSRWSEVFVGDGVFFLDPDCYSRMTRVQLIQEGGGISIRHHDFENAPVGTIPHTTMPLDLLIVALAGCFHTFGGMSIAMARDLGGALVSPVLGALFLCVCAARLIRIPHGWIGFLLLAVSPILAHAFSVGRPDHQSLIILLVVVAVLSMITAVRRGEYWGHVSALAWALALWVSLFEPLILLAVCLVLIGIAAWGRGIRLRPGVILTFLAVLILAVILDGWRLAPPSGEVLESFPAWSRSIGELQRVRPGVIFSWIGWTGAVLPFLMIWRARRTAAAGICVAAGLLLLWLLALSSARWGYFLAAATGLCLPDALAALRWRRTAASVAILGLWPIASHWDAVLFPGRESLHARQETAAENLHLKALAERIPESPGTILAPWWLSPAIHYWSGAPCVAGSSHQSLPGIVDSARFYLSHSPEGGQTILTARNVRWIIADDPDRVVSTSAALLQVAPPPESLAHLLHRGRPADPSLILRARDPFFRVYERVTPAP